MKTLTALSFLLLSIAFVNTTAVAQKLADPILLWPNGAPAATGTSDEDKPAIIPFVPDAAKHNGTAVLVVPGGGFTIRAVDHEGVLVAQWLKDHGITAFLLRYRLRPLYERDNWVADGQRAMQWIRAHADEYKIATDRVGSVGFSAGANLIADMTLNAVDAKPAASDPLERHGSRPDFLILCYGSMRIPDNVNNATIASLPPVFMYGTAEDRGTTLGMASMYQRLLQGGAAVEAHLFQNGIHGSGFAVGDPINGEYPNLMYNWLKAGGFLTNKPQVELNGVVKLNGNPLLKGMVILTSIENPNDPPVIVYINNTGTGELGRFQVSESQGPVEGKYRVEVREDATRWTSNSREPFMIEMMAKQRDGKLTDEDRKKWGEYIRKRDLSPSIYNQRVYSKQRPVDSKDYVIEIKKGQEVLVEVFGK